jgi:hypothetical protein
MSYDPKKKLVTIWILGTLYKQLMVKMAEMKVDSVSEVATKVVEEFLEKEGY